MTDPARIAASYRELRRALAAWPPLPWGVVVLAWRLAAEGSGR